MRSKLIDIEVTVKHETEKAWLVNIGNDKPIWIPKSRCEVETEGGKTVLTCEENTALEKGLI